MATVIYLNNQQIQIVVGAFNKSLQIKNTYMLEAPEGSIINGMVMDDTAFIEFLKETWTEKGLSTKDVSLVVSSTKFIGKTIELPKLKPKKTLEFIRREYTDMGREGDSVFAYLPLDNSDPKLNKVYAEGIDPEFISDYMNMFEQAGIKLSHIFSGESALIGFTQCMVASRNRTFDLIIADKTLLTTILWINGSFYYYNTTRCFHDMGTLEYADDIARSVSQVIQFLKAQQIDFNLEKVLLAGIDIEHMNIYKRAIEDIGLSMPVQAFDINGLGGDSALQSYISGISGLMTNGKTDNFILSLQNLNERKKKESNKGKKTTMLLIGISFAVMLLLTIVTGIFSSIKKQELNEILDYNQSPERMAETSFFDVLSARNNFLNRQFVAIGDVEEDIKTYPLGNNKVLDVFDKCAEGYASVIYSSFDAKEGIISIVTKADNVENINKFIANLTKEDIFNDVDYTGYQFEEDTELWRINVNCVLAPEAGREETGK